MFALAHLLVLVDSEVYKPRSRHPRRITCLFTKLEVRRALERVLLDVVRRVGRVRRFLIIAGVVLVAQIRVDAGHELLQAVQARERGVRRRVQREGGVVARKGFRVALLAGDDVDVSSLGVQYILLVL